MKDFKLCYIDRDNTAYFTTRELSDQRGDDWDDAPYEHNAGTPYEPTIFHYADGRKEKDPRDWNEDGTPKWEIYTLKFLAHNMETPAMRHYNSAYSVDSINAGHVAWLAGYDSKNKKYVSVLAGTSIEKFKQKVRQCGGKIYILEE